MRCFDKFLLYVFIQGHLINMYLALCMILSFSLIGRKSLHTVELSYLVVCTLCACANTCTFQYLHIFCFILLFLGNADK